MQNDKVKYNGAGVNTPSPDDTAADGLPLPRRYAAILAVSAGSALAVIDGGIVNVALPTIAKDLNASPTDVVLIITVYQLVLVMTLLPFSALGDRLGHRRIYQGGQLMFTLATVLCFFANSLPMLVFARAIQSIGAAAALSVSSALVRNIYPSSQLGRGMGVNSVVVASSAALAPTLGGAVLAVASWQWVFAATIPFAIISLLIGRAALPGPTRLSGHFDVKGSLLSAATFGLIITGLEGISHGQHLAISLAEIGLGIMAAVVFVRQQAVSPRPIMPLDLLRNRVFALSIIGALLGFVAQMTLLVSLPFRLQAQGFSAAEVGSVLAPAPLVMMIVAPVAGTLSDRIPAGLLGGIGMAISAVALGLMGFLPDQPTIMDVAWRMALMGLGFGLFFSPNARLIIGSAPRDRAASAGGMVATTRMTGQTLGASATAGLLAMGLGNGAVPALVSAGLAAVVCVISLMRLHAKTHRPSDEEMMAIPEG